MYRSMCDLYFINRISSNDHNNYYIIDIIILCDYFEEHIKSTEIHNLFFASEVNIVKLANNILVMTVRLTTLTNIVNTGC